MAKIQKTSAEVKTAIRRKSAYSLPNNPTEAGYKASDIRNAFYKPIIDATNSALTENDRIVEEVNNVLGYYTKGVDFIVSISGINYHGSENLIYTFSNDEFTISAYEGSEETDIVLPSLVSYNGTYYPVVAISEGVFKDKNITGIEIPSSILSINNLAFDNCLELTKVTFQGETTLSGLSVFTTTGIIDFYVPKEYLSFYNIRLRRYAKKVEGFNTVANNSSRITAIEDKIPSNASSSNKLVAKSDLDEAKADITILGNRVTNAEGDISALEDRVTNAEEDIETLQSDVSDNTDEIGDIKALIPAQASTQNQLADKDFVNSTVATNTANFIGTFSSVAELEAYSGTVTNNDYAFVTTVTDGIVTAYNRYKYSGETEEWLYEYTLNNSSFTAAQWAAINSGVTAGNFVTPTALSTALQGYISTEQLATEIAKIYTGKRIVAIFNITPGNLTITLQNLTGMTSIDWGDGTTDALLTHTYENVGTYACFIYGVTAIGSNAFHSVTRLIDIEIPDSVTSIGDSAFRGCTNLTSITIPDSVTTIGTYVFHNCTRLTTLNLGNGVTAIGNHSFDNTSVFSKVYFKGLASEYSAITIGTDNTYLDSATKYYLSDGSGGASIAYPTDAQIKSILWG